MALLSYTVCFLSGFKSWNNKLRCNNKGLPAGQFSLGRIRAPLMRTIGTGPREATAFSTENPDITQEVSLTLHGEGLSGHRDVALALRWETIMLQVVVLREFHQRVVCWGGGGGVEKQRTDYLTQAPKSHLLLQGGFKNKKWCNFWEEPTCKSCR